ncbi:MAG TPA: [LysW]-lysine hydrolase [Ktedonobacteraceae bacterium]|nr:[LysW]-lysine hydrolase [Ktedonobacteraceae bacterium]
MTTTIELESTYTSGVYGKRQLAIVRGKGALLWDEEGREYIDCAGGHGVANIGHGRSEIAAALAAQAQRLITCPEIFYNDVRARLLERLVQITPEGLSRIFFCNSGTEAIEGAFKFARLATGRTGIIATLRGFHGRSMGALAATWEPHYREPFAPLLPDVSHIRYNDLNAAEQAINENTAAVIIELVQGEGGVHVASEEFVAGVARLCHERGALLIVDEVQTGLGRTGRLFACEHYNVQPDILCLAKSLAGGVPMGAVCLGERVINSGRINKGAHGSTFGGNPLACAAALATLEIIEREALPERADRLGTYALERLRALQIPLIREVRGRGLLIGIELTRRAQPYLEALNEHGVLALPAGPNVVRLLPPLVITEEQLDRVLTIVAQVLSTPPASGNGRGPARNPGQRSSTPTSEQSTTVAPVQTQSAPTIDSTPRGGVAVAAPPAPTATTTSLAMMQALTIAQSARVGTTPSVELLLNMVTIPSLSREESVLAHFLAEQARLMGLYAGVDEVGNFVACTHPLDAQMQPQSELQPVILLGHMDTVPGNIPVRIEDGILHGRGSVDAKGPLASFICATARLASCGPVERPVMVIGAVEEEAATSRGAHGVVNKYRPLACIIGEPSNSQSVTIGYKGRMLLNCSVTRSSSHSAGPLGSSSEAAAAYWERIRQYAERWNAEHSPNSAFASLQPSLRTINSEQDGLQDRTLMTIGFRLPPNFDIEAFRQQLSDWAREDEVEMNLSGVEVAFQSNRTTPLARAFIQAIRATGYQPTFKNKTGTSDMNVVGPTWGQNIVAYGPGDSRLDHTPQEHIRLDEYLHAIQVLQNVLQNLATGGCTSASEASRG